MSAIDQQVDEVFAAVDRYLDPQGVDEAEVREAIREALTPLSLTDFGLVEGEEVKFVRPGAKHMKPGRVKGVNPDGSLQITDDERGYERAIPWDKVAKRVIGPRGGTTWRPLAAPTTKGNT